MSDYKTIAPIIRRYEAEARKRFGNKFPALVNEQFLDLNKNYFSKESNPDYSAGIKKFAYLYKYSVAHGYFVFAALCAVKHSALGWFKHGEKLKIACIGGGPGSEILGVVRYLKKKGFDREGISVEIAVFDKETTWKSLCAAILEAIEHKCEIRLKFIAMDATDKETFKHFDFSGYHITISSFFMSETKKLGIANKSKTFWRHVLGSLSVGSTILLLDYADKDGKSWEYAEGLMGEFDRFETLVNEASMSMSCPDDKECLVDLESELDHRPKKKGTNFLKVASVRRV